ncbi:MAG: hypothetical protein AB1758_17470, partial [Candidatus Eremiobacterota bacterium]
ELTGLQKVCVRVGDTIARLGPGGCAAVGFGLGLLAMPALPSVTLPLITAGMGYLTGWDAKGAKDAFEAGPGSQAWEKRRESSFGPPRSVTTADAGSHFITGAVAVAGMLIGGALTGYSPVGMVLGLIPAFGAAIVTGRAAGQAERALITHRWGAEHV